MNSSVAIVLLAVLVISSFGIYGITLGLSLLTCFTFGLVYVIYDRGRRKMSSLLSELEEVLNNRRNPPGHNAFLKNINKFNDSSMYDQKHSMTQSARMDAIAEQILEYVMRDFVNPWYSHITSDPLFRESLMRTCRRAIASLSHSVRAVDWVPLLTRNFADDIASHLRLFRMATERANAQRKKDEGASKDDLESHFFDLELEMEKCVCRDLLSTTPHYENAYLHDVVDILLYLLLPPEDFRCRPLRFLLREVIVKRIFVPTLDHFSDPENVNQLVIWLLSEVNPRPEDFVSAIEMSTDLDELDAVLELAKEQFKTLQGKDSGGEQSEMVKQQMGSLEFLELTIKRRIDTVSKHSVDRACDVTLSLSDQFIQLPIHVVLNNNVAVSYLMDYLVTVGGANHIDCYLAIEGFKVSVDHQHRTLAAGETTEEEVTETVKEAALFMFQQYLSQEAITRVPVDDSLINGLFVRMKKEEPAEEWFDAIQEKIVEVLKTEERFYPAFKKLPLYTKMLLELGIISDEKGTSDGGSITSGSMLDGSVTSAYGGSTGGGPPSTSPSPTGHPPVEEPLFDEKPVDPVLSVVVETLGIGQQGKCAFALYNVRVTRTLGGRRVSGWNVLRRYSDFHLLNTIVQQKFPALSDNLSFPGKKTFNNLSAHFLDRRTKALNSYMECILQPTMLQSHPGLDKIIHDFLVSKEYTGTREALSKKMMSAVFDPIRSSVRAFGNAVTSVPDTVYGGVSRSVSVVGDGLNRAAVTIIRPTRSIETDRVAASINGHNHESIPLRVLLLIVDEVFGVRARHAWIRRQMVALLRQFVTPLGTSINRRIIDLVHWLTGEEQVIQYLAGLRDTVWPDGKLSGRVHPRPPSFHHRCRVLSRSLLLSALPDELKLILGAETSMTGVSTVSSALQNPHLNRRLIYVLLERLLITVFPNNRFEKIFAQLHSKSPRSQRA